MNAGKIVVAVGLIALLVTSVFYVNDFVSGADYSYRPIAQQLCYNGGPANTQFMLYSQSVNGQPWPIETGYTNKTGGFESIWIFRTGETMHITFGKPDFYGNWPKPFINFTMPPVLYKHTHIDGVYWYPQAVTNNLNSFCFPINLPKDSPLWHQYNLLSA